MADHGNFAANLHVQVARGGLGLGERRLDPVGDEIRPSMPPSITEVEPGVVGEDVKVGA